mgnify:CR=1 FL=1
MLRILNKYEHGFTCIPVVASLKSQGFFNLFNNKHLDFSEIVEQLNANEGYLKVALSMLEGLSWLNSHGNHKYALTEEAQFAKFIEEDVLELYQWSPDQLYFDPKGQNILSTIKPGSRFFTPIEELEKAKNSRVIYSSKGIKK